LVDLQTISVVVASVTLTVAAIYYIMTLRSTYKNRQAMLFSSLLNRMDSLDFRRIYRTMMYDWKDKTGAEVWDMMTKNPTLLDETSTVVSFFNHMGWLVKSGLLDLDAVIGNSVSIERFYGIVRPWLDEFEVRTGVPQEFPGFTFLYQEMKKNRAVIQAQIDEARRTRY
jgi:hypothetical protein